MIIKFKFLSFCGEQFQDYRAQGQSSLFVCFQKSVTKAIEGAEVANHWGPTCSCF